MIKVNSTYINDIIKLDITTLNNKIKDELINRTKHDDYVTISDALYEEMEYYRTGKTSF